MKKSFKFLLVALSALLLLLFATQPASVPPVVLILPFIIIFLILTTLLAMLFGWPKATVGVKQLQVGALGAALPTLLMVLQSVGQLTLRDAATITVLFAITYFYLYRRKMPAGVK
jgi:hypothetical protein